MSGKRGQKAALLDWANDQNQLDRTAKSTLKELASYADADCCAWAKVSTLAYGVNCSERTVQYQMRALEEAGLVRDTGRTHRLEGSTRSVPIYQLAPSVEGLGKPESMGAEIAPIAPDGCKVDGGMGAIGLHPQETIGDKELADASSPGARAAEADLEKGFRALVEACPKSLLKFADLVAAFLAYRVLAEQGVDVAQLPACARRMAGDPAFKSRRFPDPLEAWLSKGQFLGYWPDAARPDDAPKAAVDAPPPGAAPTAEQTMWRAVVGRLSSALGEGDFSYIRHAYLAERSGLLFVVASTGIARDRIRDRSWKRVAAWWAETDPAKRPLTLVSKAEFEAASGREGV